LNSNGAMKLPRWAKIQKLSALKLLLLYYCHLKGLVNALSYNYKCVGESSRDTMLTWRQTTFGFFVRHDSGVFRKLQRGAACRELATRSLAACLHVFVAKIWVGAATTQTLNCQPVVGERGAHHKAHIKVVLVLFSLSQGDESQNGSDKFNLLTKWCGSGVAPVVKKAPRSR